MDREYRELAAVVHEHRGPLAVQAKGPDFLLVRAGMAVIPVFD